MSLDLAPGVLIAKRYRLEHVLGQGGMGIVWAAVHTLTQRRVALKFLKGPVGLRPELRHRFLREARAASAVVHPNVLEVHDVFELDDGTPVMLMDLLEGETLGRRIARQGKLAVAEAADIMVQVVSAVGTAHAVGVVHRDLKPENVFLVQSASGAPSVRVLDFGIAKLMGSAGSGVETGVVTGTGSTLGTPCYMSPEQSFGEKDVDCRTDIWSLGCILYECLTGVRSVEGESLGQVVKRLISDGITPVQTLEPNLPWDLTELVNRMLSRDRDQRHRDLRDVQEVLKCFAGVTAPDFGAPVSEHTLPTGESPAEAKSSVDVEDNSRSGGTIDADAHPTLKSANPASPEGPETAGAHTVSRGRAVPRSVGTRWIVAALSVAAVLSILVARSTSRSPTAPSAAAARASAVPQSGTAAARTGDDRPAAPPPQVATGPTTSMQNPAIGVTARPPPKQDPRAARSAAAPAATSAAPPLPSASVAPPIARPRVGGLAEKPPF